MVMSDVDNRLHAPHRGSLTCRRRIPGDSDAINLCVWRIPVREICQATVPYSTANFQLFDRFHLKDFEGTHATRVDIIAREGVGG